MKEIPHRSICRTYHYLQAFRHVRWLAGFLNHQQYLCFWSQICCIPIRVDLRVDPYIYLSRVLKIFLYLTISLDTQDVVRASHLYLYWYTHQFTGNKYGKYFSGAEWSSLLHHASGPNYQYSISPTNKTIQDKHFKNNRGIGSCLINHLKKKKTYFCWEGSRIEKGTSSKLDNELCRWWVVPSQKYFDRRIPCETNKSFTSRARGS